MEGYHDDGETQAENVVPDVDPSTFVMADIP
jgi:hypothetical protein